MILYNSENRIRDLRPFCPPLVFTAVLWSVLHLSYSSEPVVWSDLATKQTLLAEFPHVKSSQINKIHNFVHVGYVIWLACLVSTIWFTLRCLATSKVYQAKCQQSNFKRFQHHTFKNGGVQAVQITVSKHFPWVIARFLFFNKVKESSS